MGATPRGKAFTDHEPAFPPREIDEAHDQGLVAVSLKGKPRLDVQEPESIAYLAVKFALVNGYCQTVLLDRFSAHALKDLIDTTDSLQWKAPAAKPSDQQPPDGA